MWQKNKTPQYISSDPLASTHTLWYPYVLLAGYQQLQVLPNVTLLASWRAVCYSQPTIISHNSTQMLVHLDSATVSNMIRNFKRFFSLDELVVNHSSAVWAHIFVWQFETNRADHKAFWSTFQCGQDTFWRVHVEPMSRYVLLPQGCCSKV